MAGFEASQRKEATSPLRLRLGRLLMRLGRAMPLANTAAFTCLIAWFDVFR